MHTFKIRKSFIFNIMDLSKEDKIIAPQDLPKDQIISAHEKFREMRKWLLEKTATL